MGEVAVWTISRDLGVVKGSSYKRSQHAAEVDGI